MKPIFKRSFIPFIFQNKRRIFYRLNDRLDF